MDYYLEMAEETMQSTRKTQKANDKKNSENVKGEWSKPMTKKEMMIRLGFGTSYKKLNSFLAEHEVRQVGGNRQLSQIRLDMMDLRTRSLFEEPLAGN